MIQLEVPDELKVAIDPNDKDIPDSAKTFQPVLFKDGNSFCCVLGPDPQEGVVGCGQTPAEALKDWDKNLQQRKTVTDKNDEVALYIQRVIDPSANEI
jgi:hypothetical protein